MKQLAVLLLLVVGILGCTKEVGKDNYTPYQQDTVPAKPYIQGNLNMQKFVENKFTSNGSVYFNYHENVYGYFADWTYYPNQVNLVNAGNISLEDSMLQTDANYNYQLMHNNPNSAAGWSGFLDGYKIWKLTSSPNPYIKNFNASAPTAFPSLLLTHFTAVPIIDRKRPYTLSWNNTHLQMI